MCIFVSLAKWANSLARAIIAERCFADSSPQEKKASGAALERCSTLKQIKKQIPRCARNDKRGSLLGNRWGTSTPTDF